MISQRERNVIRKRVHTRIRRRMTGTAERPRLNVYRSLNHIYAQVIDDAAGVTVVSASTVGGDRGADRKSAQGVGQAVANGAGEKKSDGKDTGKAENKAEKKRNGGNVMAAKQVGKLIAERARKKGITRVVFDRGGYLYHGRIKALADAAREAGLEF